MTHFPTTRWSAVRGLRSEDGEERRRSWDVVAAAYWRPVYKHLRVQWKKAPSDAEDLTQSFFASSLEREVLEDYDPKRARFRTFVRLCVDRHASNANKADGRLKRGGPRRELSAVDFSEAEAELASARPTLSPEDLFEREWSRALLTDAIERLRTECAAKDRKEAFAIFEQYDLATVDERPTYEMLANEHGVPATTITNRLALARRELRRIVLARIEELTASPGEYADEARRFFGADT